MGRKKSKPLWDQYKEWSKKAFPGKPRKIIEDWDFIMIFEERYKE